jgi:T4 RnlA family RNA ligase
MNTLYEKLIALSEDDDTPFYHSDQELGNEHYRIFSYHFTDKDSWLLPGALESRGIMFEVDENGNMIRLASRPMQKFFNKGEIDFIDYKNPRRVMDKADGSLISTYLDANGNLRVKSKASLHSDHAVASMNWLSKHPAAAEYLERWAKYNYTANLEWVSPDPLFRIVLHYNEAELILLNLRNNETGEYVYPETDPTCPASLHTADVHKLEVLEEYEKLVGIEGFVVVDEGDNWYKLKTPWYLERHRAKDFINQPHAFIELVLKDEADDVFAMIADQPEVLAEMQELQHKVITKANSIVNLVTAYWNLNKELDRKEYAIKGQSELDNFSFGLAMKYYTTGIEPNWNERLLTQIKKMEW